MKKINFAIIGFSQEIFDILALREDVQVTGFLNVSVDECGNEANIFASFQEMLRSSDVIVICNSKYTTSDKLSGIANAKKHILLENKLGFSKDKYQGLFHLMELGKVKIAHCEKQGVTPQEMVDKFITCINTDNWCISKEDFFAN